MEKRVQFSGNGKRGCLVLDHKTFLVMELRKIYQTHDVFFERGSGTELDPKIYWVRGKLVYVWSIYEE